MLDDADLPRHQCRARQPDKGVDIGPADRVEAETVRAAASAETAEGRPEIAELGRERRAFQFGFVFRSAFWPQGPFDEPFQRLAIADAVGVDGVQRKGLFGEGPQLVAEG